MLAGVCFPYYFSWKALPDECQLGDIFWGGLIKLLICIFLQCCLSSPPCPAPCPAGHPQQEGKKGCQAAWTRTRPFPLGVTTTGSPGTPSPGAPGALPVRPVPTLAGSWQGLGLEGPPASHILLTASPGHGPHVSPRSIISC